MGAGFTVVKHAQQSLEDILENQTYSSVVEVGRYDVSDASGGLINRSML